MQLTPSLAVEAPKVLLHDHLDGGLRPTTIIELAVLVSIVKDLSRSRGTRTWRVHVSKQGPGVMTVLLEDLAAVLGCVIAAAALLTCHLTQDGTWDAIAQLVIGTMLTVVGLYLVWRNRGMLVGQAIPDDELTKLRVFIEDLDGIDRITNLKTRQLGAKSYVLKAEVVFSGGELAQRLIGSYAERVREHPAEFLGRFADELMEEQARLVDRWEDEIREHFPGAVHIALEPHLRDF